jgi:hypothetical protein
MDKDSFFADMYPSIFVPDCFEHHSLGEDRNVQRHISKLFVQLRNRDGNGYRPMSLS